eukprot:TRINITY_DN5493_c0_g1_i1.p1 TRINITY_DN5493_c0_g1~~TRINITY_DN5493_c0_g1_i1.p1  ORF type:complete len:122 (+),score=8.93 TRINITY_DN5493_c0_g1_i1:234-599(+)
MYAAVFLQVPCCLYIADPYNKTGPFSQHPKLLASLSSLSLVCASYPQEQAPPLPHPFFGRGSLPGTLMLSETEKAILSDIECSKSSRFFSACLNRATGSYASSSDSSASTSSFVETYFGWK